MRPVPGADLVAVLDAPTRAALAWTLPPHLPGGRLDVATVRAIDARISERAAPPQPPRTASAGRVALRVHGPRVEDAQPEDEVPAVLWIHGGGMILGSAASDDAYCAELSAALGVAVVAVDYRLAPEHPYPAAIDDCLAALDWCAARAARVVIAGGSAGGGLAAGAALRVRDAGDVPAAGLHLYYPMLDDRHVTESSRQLAEAPVWNRRLADLAWAAYLGGGPADSYAAPARASDLSGLPPVYLDVGDVDLFVDEDAAFAERLATAGVDVEFHLVSGGVHAFEHLAPDTPRSRDAVARRLAALRRHLGLDHPSREETP